MAAGCPFALKRAGRQRVSYKINSYSRPSMGNRPLHFVTLSGVPINVAELRWPFHPSTSGSDWFVLHGRADLLDSDGLHIEVAVGMTQTIKDALGSLDPEHTAVLVINSILKTL